MGKSKHECLLFRNMEVAALVSAISPAMSPSLDSLEVSRRKMRCGGSLVAHQSSGGQRDPGFEPGIAHKDPGALQAVLWAASQDAGSCSDIGSSSVVHHTMFLLTNYFFANCLIHRKVRGL